MTTDRNFSGEELSTSPASTNNNNGATKKTTTLNPNAKAFQIPKSSSSATNSDNGDLSPDTTDHDSGISVASSPQVAMNSQPGGYQLNGEMGKYTALGYPTTSESPVFPLANPYIPGAEYSYLPDGQLVQPEDYTQQEPPKGEELRKLLQRQLEYYFSRENLTNDRYLQSQMDADQYVAIETIANFNAVKKLTQDLTLIVDVLRESPLVQVDSNGEKVRPNHKRCTIILREVDESTPLEDVKALFNSVKCPKFVSCEFAHNNNWYITFESDTDAQAAHRYLREEVKTFLGRPIMARIKAKPLQRMSFSPKIPNGFTSHNTGQTTVYPPQQFTFQTTQTLNGINGMNGITAAPHPQQQYPFYPASVIQQWPTSPTFFDPTSLQGYGAASAFPSPNFSVSNVNRQPQQTYHTRLRQQSKPLHAHRSTSTPELTDTLSLPDTTSLHKSQVDRRSVPNSTSTHHLISPQGTIERDMIERREEKELGSSFSQRRREIPHKSRFNDDTAIGSTFGSSMSGNQRRNLSGGSGYRGRRREDTRSSSVNKTSQKKEETNLQSSPPPPPDFSAFPPLPGRSVSKEDGSKDDEEQSFTPMADIVKGVKDPIKRPPVKVPEPKQPPPPPPPPTLLPSLKDSSANSVESNPSASDKKEETAPPAPVSHQPVSRQAQIQVATQTDLEENNHKQQEAVNRPTHSLQTSAQPTSSATTSVAVCTSTTVSTATPTVMSSTSSSASGTSVKKPVDIPARLSYAQVISKPKPPNQVNATESTQTTSQNANSSEKPSATSPTPQQSSQSSQSQRSNHSVQQGSDTKTDSRTDNRSESRQDSRSNSAPKPPRDRDRQRDRPRYRKGEMNGDVRSNNHREMYGRKVTPPAKPV